MRAPLLVAMLALVSCGGADLTAEARSAPAAPSTSPLSTSARSATARPAPAATPTGPSIRVTDGQAVVALDPATGGQRAAWPDAALSLEGNWTLAVDDTAAARWIDAYGVLDRTGSVPAGYRPTVTNASGGWVVFAEPAPPVVAGEIGPARTTSRFVVTDGRDSTTEFALDGNFAPEAFGWFDQNRPMSLHLIEYLPPDHPTRYRVRMLDLATGMVGLPVSLRDKGTPVDESMAGTSRTQAYAASTAMLYTLYQPVALDPAHPYDAWEYGFVHTLATPYAGVWCIDLPEELGMTGNTGTLALSPSEETLYVVTGAGRIGVIRTTDELLAVSRTADLGTTSDVPPVMAAGGDRLWVGLGRQLLVVDPTSLEVMARTELPAPVAALTLDPATHELLAADDAQLRRWTVDVGGRLTETGAVPLPDGLGTVARIAA